MNLQKKTLKRLSQLLEINHCIVQSSECLFEAVEGMLQRKALLSIAPHYQAKCRTATAPRCYPFRILFERGIRLASAAKLKRQSLFPRLSEWRVVQSSERLLTAVEETLLRKAFLSISSHFSAYLSILLSVPPFGILPSAFHEPV